MISSMINRYSLKIKNESIQKEYIASHTNQIFITGIVLSIIRLLRLLFAALIPDASE